MYNLNGLSSMIKILRCTHLRLDSRETQKGDVLCRYVKAINGRTGKAVYLQNAYEKNGASWQSLLKII